MTYGSNEECLVTNVPTNALAVVKFDVEGDPWPADLDYDGNGDNADDCPYDYLQVGDAKYCGEKGPVGAVASDGVIFWSSDSWGWGQGWKVCVCRSLPPQLPSQEHATPRRSAGSTDHRYRHHHHRCCQRRQHRRRHHRFSQAYKFR